ncbi:MAG TPA: PilN domain-containing protein [Xanthomonadaceae bacterium]|nr:PilN domain-containing protein [Xanthomonadaceae bacterium]
MAKIDLLPWREERRKGRAQEFYIVLAAVAIAAVLAVLAVNWHFGELIKDQENRNKFLNDEIRILDTKIREIEQLERTRERLLARAQVIEQLQETRSQMVHLFDELVKTIPDGVRLTGIRQAGNVLTLEGVAQSNQRVSTYLRQLDSSGWLTQPNLRIIEARGTDQLARFTFSLTIRLTRPKPEGDEGDETVAGRTSADLEVRS